MKVYVAIGDDGRLRSDIVWASGPDLNQVLLEVEDRLGSDAHECTLRLNKGQVSSSHQAMQYDTTETEVHVASIVVLDTDDPTGEAPSLDMWPEYEGE